MTDNPEQKEGAVAGTGLYDLLGIDPEDPAQRAAEEDTDEFVALIDTLVAMRKGFGLTQAEVAEAMGTTQSAVSDIERIGGDPRISTVQRYARAVRARLHLRVSTTALARSPADSGMRCYPQVPSGRSVPPRQRWVHEGVGRTAASAAVPRFRMGG